MKLRVPGKRRPRRRRVLAHAAMGGVVVASRVFVADALAAGLLEAPFPQTRAGDAYRFACALGLNSAMTSQHFGRGFRTAFP